MRIFPSSSRKSIYYIFYSVGSFHWKHRHSSVGLGIVREVVPRAMSTMIGIRMSFRAFVVVVAFVTLKPSICIADISEIYAEGIITSHGGSNGTLTASDFESYVNHLQNLSNNRNLVWHGDVKAIVSRTGTAQLADGKSRCYTASELLNLVPPETGSDVRTVSPGTLVALCPVILQQLDNRDCNFLNEENRNDEVDRSNLASGKPSPLEVWGYGFLFVTIINLSAIFGAVLLPLMGKKFFNMLLTTLIGLAVGSLSSSAAFHLMPQAFGLVPKNGAGGGHAYLWTSLLVLFGIYLFFMLERFLKIFIDFKKTKKEHKHDHKIEFKQGKDSAIATVAWMIVFGDGLHNFIDGLSIGAAFNESILTGISISVAVICEELPHELGDLAVLLNSGMSVKQALLYNFLSALTCYLGLIIGTLLGELAEASMCIFAIAAGVFLYISLVDMVPEMNEEVENASQVGVSEALKVIGLQNIGWITGTVILFTLAYYADHLSLK